MLVTNSMFLKDSDKCNVTAMADSGVAGRLRLGIENVTLDRNTDQVVSNELALYITSEIAQTIINQLQEAIGGMKHEAAANT